MGGVMGGGPQAMGEGLQYHSREDTRLRDHVYKGQTSIDEEFPLA